MKKLLPLVTIAIVACAIYLPNKTSVDQSVQRWINFSFCDRPIKYKIGYIDPKFNLTEAELRVTLLKAEGIWEKAIDKNLFEYDTNGHLTINMVYDSRHELLKAIYEIETEVNSEKDEISITSAQYEEQKAQVERELSELNKEIDYWNSKGGAPKDTYNQLVGKQKELMQKIEMLNAFANKINSTVVQINSEVHELNTKVENFNILTNVHPEKGLYTSGINRIEIYFYSNENDLAQVLAHEMGHGLGLEHVNEEGAIMNPVTSENTIPTAGDIQEITALCTNKKRIDIIKGDVQNYLYILISNFKNQVVNDINY